jgi:hypothetical protein
MKRWYLIAGILAACSVAAGCWSAVRYAARDTIVRDASVSLLKPFREIDPHARNLIERLERANELSGNREIWNNVTERYNIRSQRPSDGQVVFLFHRKPMYFWSKLANPRMIIALCDLQTSATTVKTEDIW